MKQTNDKFTRVIYALVIGLFIAVVYYLINIPLVKIFSFRQSSWMESLFLGLLLSFGFEFIINPYVKKKFETKPKTQ